MYTPIGSPAIECKITVMYQDTEGNQIADSEIYSGIMGSEYNIERKSFEGYEFEKVLEGSTEEKGTFKEEENWLIYIYKKIEENKPNPAPQPEPEPQPEPNPEPEPAPQVEKGKITVKYQDENGNSIKDDVVLEDEVGKEYKTEKIEFEKYEFVEVNGKEEGKFEKEEQIVIYKYNKPSWVCR